MVPLLADILPVFALVGIGYFGTRLGWFREVMGEGLMAFALKLAVPALLFRAMSNLDLADAFVPRLHLSFFGAAAICFGLGILGARVIFRRRPGESVAVGFGGLFSNALILGIPIIERAFGEAATGPAFAIIALHSPFCYLLGITTMELLRADGRSLRETAIVVARAMFRNTIMVGLALGLSVNAFGLPVPGLVDRVVSALAGAALPAALVGMGVILTRCRVRQSIGEASMTAMLSLIVHPALVLFIGGAVFQLPPLLLTGAVIIAAMPSGINVFVFASQYQRAVEASASAVLLATALAVFTVPVWILIVRQVTG